MVYGPLKRDAELAATYENDPPSPTLTAGKGMAFSQGITHYRRFAGLYQDQAERTMKLAALQEEMAEKAEAAREPNKDGASTPEKKELAAKRRNHRAAIGWRSFERIGGLDLLSLVMVTRSGPYRPFHQ